MYAQTPQVSAFNFQGFVVSISNSASLLFSTTSLSIFVSSFSFVVSRPKGIVLQPSTLTELVGETRRTEIEANEKAQWKSAERSISVTSERREGKEEEDGTSKKHQIVLLSSSFAGPSSRNLSCLTLIFFPPSTSTTVSTGKPIYPPAPTCTHPISITYRTARHSIHHNATRPPPPKKTNQNQLIISPQHPSTYVQYVKGFQKPVHAPP